MSCRARRPWTSRRKELLEAHAKKGGQTIKKLIIIAIFLALAAPAWGEIPEVVVGGQGMDDVYLLNLSIDWKLGRFGVSARQLYGQTGGETTANDSTVTFGFAQSLSWRWGIWSDGTWHRNSVDRYSENMVAAGLTYTAYMSGITSVKLSAGPMRHDLRRDDGHSETLTRLSSRFQWKRETEETLAKFTAFHRPNVEDRRDYLASAVLEFGVKSGKGQRVGVRLEDHYRSIVPEGQRPHTTTWFFTWTIWGGE